MPNPVIKAAIQLPYVHLQNCNKRQRDQHPLSGSAIRKKQIIVSGVRVRFRRSTHSRLLQFTPTTKHMKKRIDRLGRKIVADILVHHDRSGCRGLVREYLKSPMNNRPCSAFLTSKATDMYFGVDYADDASGCLEGPSTQTSSYRAAYASSSAESSISIDPFFKQYHSFSRPMSELLSVVKNIAALYCTNGVDGAKFNLEFNCVSVKGYWDGKYVNWHSDIEYDRLRGTPKRNSQVPGTPVIIINFGDDKVCMHGLVLSRRYYFVSGH